ncbi:hypothetical protein [Alteromonas halophila]|uniref:Protein tyrosine phosphatase n=1 Tax=Alteromonas halophila TaxID=516698 RepID=A0A918MX42_9ALTE|nr:hypothetical protein [Alteromonas halophila]GGW81338.1 hypothetical protein GCM10007391_13140 [Alteromonas halophila]
MTQSHADNISLWQGQLSLGAVPDNEKLRTLADQGYTHVGCCLTDSEIEETLPSRAREAGLQWTWLPYTLSALDEASDTHYLRRYLSSLRSMLMQPAKIHVFCDDSATRCILLSYALCLNAGMSTSSAYFAVWSLTGDQTHQVKRAQLSAVANMNLYG